MLHFLSWFAPLDVFSTLLDACMLCHFIRVWLCDPMDHSPPGSSAHGILQARILEWGAISFSRGSVSCSGRQVIYHYCHLGSLTLLCTSPYILMVRCYRKIQMNFLANSMHRWAPLPLVSSAAWPMGKTGKKWQGCRRMKLGYLFLWFFFPERCLEVS